MTKQLLVTRQNPGCRILELWYDDMDECTCRSPETHAMTDEEWFERLGSNENDGTEYAEEIKP